MKRVCELIVAPSGSVSMTAHESGVAGIGLSCIVIRRVEEQNGPRVSTVLSRWDDRIMRGKLENRKSKDLVMGNSREESDSQSMMKTIVADLLVDDVF